MTYMILLAALALVPALAILLLRVNGAIAFMSLCLGSVLVTYTAGDVTGVVTSLTASNSSLSGVGQWIRLGLLVIPFLLTVLFTRRSIKGSKNLTNVLPAVAAGLLCALLSVPLLAKNMQRQVHSLSIWHQLNDAQTAIILGGALFSLVFLLFTHRRRKGDEEGKKKGRHKE